VAAFEMQDTTITNPAPLAAHETEHDRRKVKDECLIAYKVYDSCRRQNCLTPRELGPARAAEDMATDKINVNTGDIIVPISGTASVTMDRLTIKRIQVGDKQPSPFRAGFWDVSIKYVFEYWLTFRDAGGTVIGQVRANNTFDMKATLFGSTGGDLVIGTDLYNGSGGSTFTAAPFIWTEAKAVALDAKISHHHHGEGEIHVTIGLFSILKLFRLVNLNVQSKGFCIPDACQDQSDINPCEYFADLDFPVDVFAPPQRKEFYGGGGGILPAYMA